MTNGLDMWKTVYVCGNWVNSIGSGSDMKKIA